MKDINWKRNGSSYIIESNELMFNLLNNGDLFISTVK